MGKKLSTIFRLIISILIPQAIGGIGSLFTITSVSTWYAELNKPYFNPPDWIFGPVWTVLYLMMGVAFYLIWKEGLQRPEIRCAAALFAIQLALNLVWSLLFFYLKLPLAAFIEILLLWVSIAATMLAFFKISRLAGLLFVPYLLWVGFAAVLNVYLWHLNA